MIKIISPVFIFTLLIFLIFTFLFIDPNLIYFHKFYTGFALDNRTIATFLYVFLVSILFIFYIVFLKNHKNIDIKKLVFISCIILFFSYPAILSYDIFNYLTTSKVLFFYKENPYIIMPIEFIGDPFLLFTRAANKLALYGPVWLGISGVSLLFGFGNFILTLFNFKLLIVLFYLGSLLLISKISKKRESVLIFALSPLVLIEVLVSSHNDIVMMFFALLSIYFLRSKRILPAILFLLMSILIKYATIFLLPVFIYTAVRTVTNRKINWEKMYFYSFISMLAIFLLSILREEIYPWYAIWPLSFLALNPKNKTIVYTFIALTFGLMLSYAPYMYFATYEGLSRIIRIGVIFLPPILYLIYSRLAINKLNK